MRSTIRGTLAVTVALAAVVGMTGTADADKHTPVPTQQQVDDAKAAVTRKAGDVASIRAALVLAQTKLENAAEKAEIASEAYNGAQYRLGEAKKETVAATAASKAATEHVAAERAALASLATQAYQDGTALNGLTVFFSKGGPEQVLSEVGVTQSAASTMQARYDQYKADDALATAARERAEKAQANQEALVQESARLRDLAGAAAQDAQREASSIAAHRRQLIGQLAAAQRISVALATQRQAGLERIAEQRAAAAAAAKARAEAAAAAAEAKKNQAKNDDAGSSGGGSGGGSGNGGGSGDPTPPASTGAAARAIAFARAQIGDPYVWAAAGPNSWDCSGLTMMAWRAGGVSLPHYSVAQYEQTRHIGVGDLRPGDLVFWGDSPGTIHHVAMYIGNGQILHAPRTGRDVEIDSMYYWIPPNYFGRP